MQRVVVRALLLLLALPVMAQNVDITLDRSTTYQTMTHAWEGTAYLGQEETSWPNFHTELMNRLVTDIGINRMRFEVRASSENVTDFWQQFQDGDITQQEWAERRYTTINDDGNPSNLVPANFIWSEIDWVIVNGIEPLRAALAAQGELLYVNLCYVAFTAGNDPALAYHHDTAAEYAEFIYATFKYLDATYGWVPDAVEIILEPDNNIAEWNSGTIIGNALVAAGDKLAAAVEGPWTPDFIAPSNTNASNAITYFDALDEITGWDTYLTELSYHRYQGASTPTITALGNLSVANNIGATMNEWWFDNATYLILHEDLTEGKNTSWQQYTLYDHFDNDQTDPQNPILTLKDEVTFTRLYTKWVREGAVRFDVTSSDAGFEALGFQNEDTRTTIVIKSTSGVSRDLVVAGLGRGTYGIEYALVGSTATLANQTIAAGGTVNVTMPGTGVITVYQKSLPALN